LIAFIDTAIKETMKIAPLFLFVTVAAAADGLRKPKSHVPSEASRALASFYTDLMNQAMMEEHQEKYGAVVPVKPDHRRLQFFDSLWNTWSSVFACETSWLLQPTFKFGLDANLMSVNNVDQSMATLAADAIEAGLKENGKQELFTCTFKTERYDFIGIGTTDSTANTIELSMDWGIKQEGCGVERAYHQVLKGADWSNVARIYNQFGSQYSNTFLSAIKTMQYTCPRDAEC